MIWAIQTTSHPPYQVAQYMLFGPVPGGRQSLTLAYLISSTPEAHAKAQKHPNDAKEGKGFRTEIHIA
jgi:hypothetical protein